MIELPWHVFTLRPKLKCDWFKRIDKLFSWFHLTLLANFKAVRNAIFDCTSSYEDG